jgi:hypothetical protein
MSSLSGWTGLLLFLSRHADQVAVLLDEWSPSNTPYNAIAYAVLGL